MCVAKDLEGLKGSTGLIAHDGDMRFPIEAEMKEEPEVPHDGFRCDPIVRVGGLIHEVQAIRGGVEADTRGSEVDELCLCWLCREVVAEEPFVAETVLFTKEGVDLQPGRGLGKDDAIVNVHAQSGVRGFVEVGEERGGVEGRKDRGEWGPLRSADRLIAKGAHLPIEGQVDAAIRKKGQGRSTQARGKAKVHKNGREAVLVDIVKEALNVEHEGSAVKATAVCNVDVMEEGEANVQRA